MMKLALCAASLQLATAQAANPQAEIHRAVIA
jgi:hypothetical protein